MKKPAAKREKPIVPFTLDQNQINWLDKNVGNRSAYIRGFLDVAMLLPHPEDFKEIINRHIKAKMLESNRLQQLRE